MESMTNYAELGTVRMWYEEWGTGKPLVLLHGGAVDSRFFAPNVARLAERFRVVTPDARGHGRTPDVEGPFTHELLAQDLVAFLQKVIDGPAHLVGHGEGAVVAMYVALRRPDLVDQLVAISGTFRASHTPEESDPIDIDGMITYFGARYGEVSPDGEAHYRVVAEKDAQLVTEGAMLTEEDLGHIMCRTLVMAGDDDIPLEHTIALYHAIPGAELAIVPGTSHFLTQEKPEICKALVIDFLAKKPTPTIAPVRRADYPPSL